MLDFLDFPEQNKRQVIDSPKDTFWTIEYQQMPTYEIDSRLFTQEIMGEFLPEPSSYRHQNTSIGYTRQVEIDGRRSSLVLNAGQLFVNADVSSLIRGTSPQRLICDEFADGL